MEQNQNKVKNLKNRKFTAYAALLSALVLAVAIPINLLGSRLNVIWDMTPAKMYKLSKTTTSYLDKLDETVDFYFLMDMDMLATNNDSIALYYTLKQYSEYDCINFVDFDPNNEPKILEEINPDGTLQLTIGDIVIRHGENVKRVPGKYMYTYKYSTDENGAQYVEEAYFEGENHITGAIDAVVTGRSTKIYFLTGHGEKTLENDYTMFNSNLAKLNYVADELNLSTAESVPEDAAIVILAAPQNDLTNDETRKLNAYLDKGGNVSFLMSPNKDDVIYKNIESIMESFGIGMDYDIVAETNPSLYVGDKYTYQVSLVASESDLSAHLTNELIEMTNSGYYAFMRNCRSFYRYNSPKDSTLQVESLIQTVESKDEMGNPVYTAVGEAYGGNATEDITGYALDLVMHSMSPARNDAKILVFGDANFIDDTTEEHMIIPVNLMLAAITWMHDSSLDLDMGIADKAKDYDYMKLNSETAATGTVVLFVVVPFIVALIGLGVWLKRRYS